MRSNNLTPPEMLKELKDRRRRLKKKYDVLVSRRRSSSVSGTTTPATNTSFTNSTPVIIPGHSQPSSPRTSDEFNTVNNNNNNLASSELTASRHYESRPTCDHGESASIYRVKKEGPNQGRLFYACGARDRDGRPARCNFFQWADDGPPATPPKQTTPQLTPVTTPTTLVAPLMLSGMASPSIPNTAAPSSQASPQVKQSLEDATNEELVDLFHEKIRMSAADFLRWIATQPHLEVPSSGGFYEFMNKTSGRNTSKKTRAALIDCLKRYGAMTGAPLASSSFSAGMEYLEQSIFFQKAHRLLVQHEELIRLTRSVRDKYYVANQPNTKHLDPAKLRHLRDEVYQVMESLLEDAKKLVMLMKK